MGELKERYIILDEMLIRELKLPDTVAQAIERKLEQEQRFLEYKYRIDAEQEEIKRKYLEAYGIKLFQETISKNLTPNYLKFKGIQATLDLAKSPNSKILLIGNTESGGLPLILNAETNMPGIINPSASNTSEMKVPDSELEKEKSDLPKK